MADSAAEFLPSSSSLTALRRASAGCRGCDLWRDATQTVFGAGPARASLMLIGEQPGDREDREGKPFVGPAGKLLQRKRRLHQTPRAGEIEACKPWLRAELEAIEPEVVLALGATAARALLGAKVRVTKDRGKALESPLTSVAMVTIHPSAILRLRESDERAQALAELVDDLEAAKAAAKSQSS